ncbi:MAG: hypothetical protein SXA11_11150 [Cyanobacteriota bacterium]|nr:hypothetical protein [Cyanobacteriota bacterium]
MLVGTLVHLNWIDIAIGAGVLKVSSTIPSPKEKMPFVGWVERQRNPTSTGAKPNKYVGFRYATPNLQESGYKKVAKVFFKKPGLSSISQII